MGQRILLVTWDGAGNFPPEQSLCSALIDAGYEVFILTHDSLKDKVQAIGATFLAIRHAKQVGPEDDDVMTTVENVICSELHL